MKCTFDQLDAAIFNILQNRDLMIAAGTPRACSIAAEKCFLDQIPENEDTKIIRYQLLALRQQGWFDLIENSENL